METNIKILLDSNIIYKKYLRSNSYWYKILNRNPELIDKYIKEVKEAYKLTTTDKINNVIDKIDMVSKIINTLK